MSYFRSPDDLPDGDAGSVPAPAAAPEPPQWIVVATTTSAKVAAELLERFDANEILGRSLRPEGPEGTIAIEVPVADEARATEFIDEGAVDLLEYQSLSDRLADRDHEQADARGGLVTVAMIFGVLIVIGALVLVAG